MALPVSSKRNGRSLYAPQKDRSQNGSGYKVRDADNPAGLVLPLIPMDLVKRRPKLDSCRVMGKIYVHIQCSSVTASALQTNRHTEKYLNL